MYENTHFLTPQEAWEHVVAEAESSLRLYACELRAKRQSIAVVERRCADSAVEYDTARANYEDWKERQNP